MGRVRNEEQWLDIEDCELMARCTRKDAAWRCLEALQQGNRLTQLDLINLLGLLQALEHQEPPDA